MDILRRFHMQKTLVNYLIMTIALTLLIPSGYFYWRHQQRYPNTDDAYIQAHVINIATQVSGKVEQVLVQNQEHVNKDQLLFTINSTPFKIALKKAQADLQNTQQAVAAEASAVKAAEATLRQREAQLIDAQKNYNRIMSLVKQGFYARSGGDNVTRELTVAKQAVAAAKDQLAQARAKLGATDNSNAQIQAAQAAIAQAQLNLQYTQVHSPAAGQLAQLKLQPGQTVTAYESLFSLVEDKAWWAMANMKETDMSRIRVGQKARIEVDMYASHVFHGVVRSISPGSGVSFALLPAENATGNWVKVTQRFPVRVEITDLNAQYPLRIGASCTVTIDTHST